MDIVQINSAQIEDYEAIHAIMLEAQDFHVQLKPDYFRSLTSMFSREQFEEILAQDIVLTAKYEGKLVGCAILQRKCLNSPTKYPRKSLYIDAMTVSQAYRGKGIGTRFLEKAKEIAKKEQLDCLELQVYSNNDKAIQLYENFGFTPQFVHMELKLD